ncbi:MAG: Mrp/NBP35 family ATP-binding protein [Gemmatimonadota bacterium]|jgi:ATP-binding protein involved in chromosome partitioning
MAERLEDGVRRALESVVNERTGRDVLSSGQAQGIEISADGRVTFQFQLGPEDPGTLVRAARAAVEAVEGVTRVKIDVRLPTAPAQGRSQGHGRTLKPGSVPAPTPSTELTSEIGRIIAVSSGKGGVGKSTVAANLAAQIARQGHRVGLLDADVYGPNIPLMFGEKRRPQVTGGRGQERIVPLESHGVLLMSLGFLLEAEQPAIMRGPLVSGILRQFLEQVEWGPLDYMIVDMPPGTGDAQLSLVQLVNVHGAVLVTTPQDVSVGDVRRAVRMFERVRTPVLGVVENMSGMACPHCGGHVDVFGAGGGIRLAESVGTPFLGGIPLDPAVSVSGDEGRPTVVSAPDSPAGKAFAKITDAIVAAVAVADPAAN